MTTLILLTLVLSGAAAPGPQNAAPQSACPERTLPRADEMVTSFTSSESFAETRELYQLSSDPQAIRPLKNPHDTSICRSLLANLAAMPYAERSRGHISLYQVGDHYYAMIVAPPRPGNISTQWHALYLFDSSLERIAGIGI